MNIKVTKESNNSSELAELTDHAILQPKDVEYLHESRTVIIPITRFPFVTTPIRLPILKIDFGCRTKYNKEKPVKSIVTIRNVIECKLNDTTDDKVSEVTLIFGITVRDNTAFFTSAEESMGLTLFELSLKMTEVDIELKDVD